MGEEGHGESVMESQVAAVRRFNASTRSASASLEEGLLKSDFSLTERASFTKSPSAMGPPPPISARSRGRPRLSQPHPGAFFVRQGLLAKTTAVGRAPSIAWSSRRPSSRRLCRARRRLAGTGGRVGGGTVPGRPRSGCWRPWRPFARLLDGKPALGIPYILRPPPVRRPWPGHIQARGPLLPRNTAGTRPSRPWLPASVADFARSHDPRRERCWIAERDGEAVGAVFLSPVGPRWPSCGCSMSSPRREASESAPAWS